MRRSGRSQLQRVLCLLVAALALLCGSGAHEALHELGVSRTATQPTSPIEAHDASCPHRGDVPLHEHSLCVVCKSGGLQQVALPQAGPHVAPLDALCLLPLAVDAIASPALIPGSIGARAPPVNVG